MPIGHKRPSPAKEQKKVDKWNANHPSGTPVIRTDDFGEEHQTVTTGAAQLLSGHTAVIWTADMSGCYDLDRMRPH